MYLSASTSVRRIGGGSSVLKRINHVCRLRCAKGVSVGFEMLLSGCECCCRVRDVVLGFEISSSGSMFCCRVWNAMSRLRYLCRDPYIFLNLVSVHSKSRQNILKQTVCLLSDSRLVVGRFVDFANGDI